MRLAHFSPPYRFSGLVHFLFISFLTSNKVQGQNLTMNASQTEKLCLRANLVQSTKEIVRAQSSGIEIVLSEGDNKFVPLQGYTVRLVAPNSRMITDFFLVAADPRTTDDTKTFGHFTTIDGFSKGSETCPNLMVKVDRSPKRELKFRWVAPDNVGCVQFRASVRDQDSFWYSEDEGLVKNFCSTPGVTEDGISPLLTPECCACGYAKYEIVFEGIWSRETHPKDFPTGKYAAILHWSSIVGASHSRNFSMYEYGNVATDAVKNMCETASPRGLYNQFNNQSHDVRTVINARGVVINLNRLRFARFSVNRTHHLLSLITMLGPSPDWCVGLSSLNMCAKNCSWYGTRVLNLYPFDAGTNDAITYTSQRKGKSTREPIFRYNGSYPPIPGHSLYNPGRQMVPVARILLKRLPAPYADQCRDGATATRPRSATRNWVSPAKTTQSWLSGGHDNDERNEAGDFGGDNEQLWWLNSSDGSNIIIWNGTMSEVNWGDGPYVLDSKGNVVLASSMVSLSPPPSPRIRTTDTLNKCQLSSWSDWSRCSVTCGSGFRARERSVLTRPNGSTRRTIGLRDITLDELAKLCSGEKLREKQSCLAQGQECDVARIDPGICSVTDWSSWTLCSETCGPGRQSRRREYLRNAAIGLCVLPLDQSKPCFKHPCNVNYTVVCRLPKRIGNNCKAFFNRWYYDQEAGKCQPFVYSGCDGNENNFGTLQACVSLCHTHAFRKPGATPKPRNKRRHNSTLFSEVAINRTKDCLFTQWSSWQSCERTCGTGWRQRVRTIRRPAIDDGRPCPRKLVERNKCRLRPCPKPARDCDLAPWQPWSSCDRSCGIGTKARIRAVIQRPEGEGRKCKPRRQREFCQLPPCPLPNSDSLSRIFSGSRSDISTDYNEADYYPDTDQDDQI